MPPKEAEARGLRSRGPAGRARRRPASGVATFALHKQPGKNPGPGLWLGACRDPRDEGLTLNAHGVWTRAGRQVLTRGSVAA